MKEKQKYLRQRRSAEKKQRGIVLFITLIVLVAMMLASVGMMRSVDTSVAAVGNLAFRQASDAAVGSALEQAVRNLASGAGWLSDLNQNAAANGYYAMLQPNEDSKGIPANLQTSSGTGVIVSLADAAGNTTRTVIERMCNSVGVPSPTTCLGSAGAEEDAPNKAGELVALELGSGDGFSAYYRVTVRVDGPNGTVSFAQAIIKR